MQFRRLPVEPGEQRTSSSPAQGMERVTPGEDATLRQGGPGGEGFAGKRKLITGRDGETTLLFLMENQNDVQAFDGLVNAALKIAHQDAARRRTLKDAILRDDVAQVLDAACALVGVQPSGQILELIRKTDIQVSGPSPGIGSYENPLDHIPRIVL
jgi:hypothetical protein